MRKKKPRRDHWLSTETEILDTLFSCCCCFRPDTVCTVPNDACDYEKENPQKRLSTETEILDTLFFFLLLFHTKYSAKWYVWLWERKPPEETVNRDWNIGLKLLFSCYYCFRLNRVCTVPSDVHDYRKENPRKRSLTFLSDQIQCVQ